MKKIFLAILMAVITAFSSIFALACAPETPNEPEVEEQTPVVSVLKLDRSSISLEKLEEITLVATLDDEVTTDVQWSTTNQNVITVANGVVSAVGEGTAVVVATSGELQARCLVKVSDRGLVPGLTTNIGLGDKLCLINGDSFKVEYQVTYNNKIIDDAVVSLTLEENDCADLENDIVTAKGVGDAGKLIISATWKGLTTTSPVEVSVVDNANAQLTEKLSLTLCNDERGGQTTETLNPSFISQDKILTPSEYSIINWEYDENVVSVNPSTLEVSGVGKGQTTIVATFKDNQTDTTIQSVLPVSVYLYEDDKTDLVTLDTLFLDRQDYFVDVLDVFADKSSQDLTSQTVNAITDITGPNQYRLPIVDGKVSVEEINKYSITGERVWRVECNKYCYLVKVPTAEVDPAKNLIGKYLPADWDYTMEIVYDKNDVVAKFSDKSNGNLVDTGICDLAPWKNNNYLAGRIVIDMNSTAIAPYNITGYYIYSSGCYQMSLAKTTSETVSVPAVCQFELYSETILAPYADFSGNFETADDITFVLNEDKSVLVNGTIAGEYTLTPTAPLSGKINITLESALNGQTSFEGEYSYNKGGAEFDISINSVAKQFVRENSSDIYLKYANHKNAGWVVLRFFEDGTFVFNYAWDKISSNTMGVYQLIPDADSTVGNEKGVVILDMVAPYNNRSHYEGTYYVDADGVYVLKFEPMTLLNKELIYKPR